ncbi:MAG: methyltransferase [Acidobacteria bacterium]|nr:methyltransferase [Acidobacteriota bacterium]
MQPPSSASAKRVAAALSHQPPDRIPIDLGSTAVTGIHVTAVAALRQHYGLPQQPVKVHEPYQMLGWIAEDLAAALGIDTVPVLPRDNMFGFPNENWKPWSFRGLEVLVPEKFRIQTEPDGAFLIFPKGDTSAPPSGRMPVGSAFFDTIIRQPPIDEDHLNVEDNLEEFSAITPQDLDHIEHSVAAAQATNRAIVATFGGTAFGDIALVPGPFMTNPKGIRDVTEWYISTKSRRPYVHKIFERQCEIGIANLARIHQRIGNAPQAVFVCGTDFGTQTSSFCSDATFRELWLPYYKQVNDWIHSNTTWKSFKHSCGSVVRFLDSFIDAGFDILNPVQCSAAGMDPASLKSKYGDRLTFWGGGVDTQKTLPFGTPQQVREEVLTRCDIFAPNGGFVFNTVHNIQAGTPVENIVAMINAVKEWNGEKP